MTLPLVDTFFPPLELYNEREATLEEMIEAKNIHLRIQTELKAYITNPYDAATHMAKVGAEPRLGDYINTALDNNAAYGAWKQAMPPKTPPQLSRYQKSYPHCDIDGVSAEIQKVGHTLSEGQCLFHGGLWPTADSLHLKTNRPLSTSFCPQVALRNAEQGGKAYDAERIDLFVLKAGSPKTKVFTYKRKNTNFGHENEVVFAAGAELSLKSSIVANTDYLAGKYMAPPKRILVRVLEVDIS